MIYKTNFEFENVENQISFNLNNESFFLLIFGKIGNINFNRAFLIFFLNVYYGEYLSLSDEEKQNHPINTKSFEQSFRLQLNNKEELIQQFELFIKNSENFSIYDIHHIALTNQFMHNILSKNVYFKSNNKNNLFTVHNELRDMISQAIDILYPIYMQYTAHLFHNDPANNKNNYYLNIIHDFHYVSCDIFTKNNQNLDEDDFLFDNFVCCNGLDVLNAIIQKDKGAFLFQILNIYQGFDHQNQKSTFFNKFIFINNNNKIFQNNIYYSPHYVYKKIRIIIQELYITSCLNDKNNKKLCCSVIHQIFDDFCGKHLVNRLINEIKQYETLLKNEKLDTMFHFGFAKHFQSKSLLTTIEINQIIDTISLHNQNDWRYFGNIKNDFFITDIFKKLSENSYVKDYVFSLLEKLLLDNDFTLLKKYYCFANIEQTIKPFSEYTKNELNDLIQNNPIFFISDWIDINHPNVYLKQVVNNFYVTNDLMKFSASYTDIWKKLTNIQINFYQQKNKIWFGLDYSDEVNSVDWVKKNKFLDSVNYLKLLEKHNIKIHEYVDINFSLLYQNYNDKDYKHNYFDRLMTQSFNQEIIPSTGSSSDIYAYQFFKNIHSLFHIYNGYYVKAPVENEPIIKNKENDQLDIRPMANFAELCQYLDDQVQKYNNNNSYYIKPIFLKIKSHGLGVSHFLEKFAESKKIPIENVDISALSTYFDLIGLSATWGNGQTGIFYNMQQKNRNKLSILYLDNFDEFRNTVNNGNAFSNSYATINKIILKKSRLNYVDEFKLSENEVVDISKIITICIGERFPDVCSKDVIESFKVFEIDFYKHNDTENPNPILENIWNNVMNEES